MHLIIGHDRLRRVLFSLWVVMVFVGFSVEYWKYILDGERTGLVYFLGLGYEANFPTWYSSALLLLCAIQLAMIATGKAQRAARYVTHWRGLAAIFLYISMDETAQVHENAGRWFDFGGFLYYGWVIPASAVVLLIGGCYVRFVWQLPGQLRRQVVWAGLLYVGGALGLDFVLGYWVDQAGTRNLTYGLIDLGQESMELLGVSLFLCALTQFSGSAAFDACAMNGRRVPGAAHGGMSGRTSIDFACGSSVQPNS